MQDVAVGSASSVETLDLYAKFSIDAQAGGVALTSSDGYCYAIVNGYLQSATDPDLTAKYGSATLGFVGWYKEAACTNAADADQLARIAAGTTVTFYVGGDASGSRLRVSTSAPENQAGFATTFGNSLGNRVAIVATFAAGGALDNFDHGTVYYAINGETTLKNKTTMDALVGTNDGFQNDGSEDSLGDGAKRLNVFSSAS